MRKPIYTALQNAMENKRSDTQMQRNANAIKRQRNETQKKRYANASSTIDYIATDTGLETDHVSTIRCVY